MGKIERLALPVAACAVLYWTVVDPNENARAAVMSSVLGYTRMATGWTVWNSGANGERHYGHWLVNVAAGVGTAVHGYRVVQCIFFADPTASALEPTASNIGFVSFGILSLLLLSIGLVMLVNDSLVNHARRLATVDELTGLLARRELLSRGEALIKAARLSRARLSVAVIDLDDFKTINDRYGHPAGDRVLRNFAKEVSRRLGCTDVFGRLGGEEFAIFFPQTASEQAAELIGTIQSSGHREQTREHDPWCTFSAGIDECCVNDTLSELISRADAALYRAKRKGKGRVELAKSDCDVSIA
ncbi:GGDEF domain-containing protein [Paraburkholderia caribensis]|uniref:GGDEF domain-containing protein n=1 Tax=Paraburkholderia caribensis TaxID=75105 RepID=UPI001F3CF27C|nr:GGDEF domain-containing protein [Paraburkholderia caribensis]